MALANELSLKLKITNINSNIVSIEIEETKLKEENVVI